MTFFYKPKNINESLSVCTSLKKEEKKQIKKKKKHCPDPDWNPWAKGDHYQRPKTRLLKRSGALTNVATEAADLLQKID